jgi:uncharacterized protein
MRLCMTSLPSSKNGANGCRIQFQRREQLFEVSVFLFLIVPSLVFSFFAVKQGSLSFVVVAIAAILRDLALVILILFFVWRNGEPVISIGWTFSRIWSEILVGIGLFIPFFFITGFVENGLKAIGFTVPSKPLPSFLAAKGLVELLLALVLVVIVAIAEETIFRGYLLLRFRTILPNLSLSAFISAIIFSLGHGYEGSAGVITVGFMGLAFAFIYLWRQSLVAPIVMHFLQDFIGIVLLPLLGKG